MAYNHPVAYYELVFTKGTMGGQIATPEEIIAELWTWKEDLTGQELFDAQRLKYEEPRKYTTYKRSDMKVGGLIYDEGKFYVIKSLAEITNFRVEIIAARYTLHEIS